MQIQFDNRIMSSLQLFVDHEILSKGLAYSSKSSYFYPVASQHQGLYAYSAPYKQLCNDTSITGANVMSGVYVDGNYVTIGQSGLHSINHYEGTVYFTGQIAGANRISGNYSVKEFNVKMTDKLEGALLFDTKYLLHDKYNQTLSGLGPNTETLPIIYLKMMGGQNKPFCLGGVDDNQINVRAVVIADNSFLLTAATNILKNCNYKGIPIYSGLPFGRNGAYTGVNYNYTGLALLDEEPLITESKVINVSSKGDYHDFQYQAAFVDFSISRLALTP